MCILISSTSHPEYPFILLSNRDEFFERNTKTAHIRESGDGKVISPLDMERAEHGTWIALSDSGKLAVLLNYMEDEGYISKISRGILPIASVESTQTDMKFYDNIGNILEDYLQPELIDNKAEDILSKIGGFTLVYGQLKLDDCTNKVRPLNVMSNRRKYFKIFDPASSDPVGKKTTFSLSNTAFDNPWPKVTQAEKSLEALLSNINSTKASQEEVVSECFSLLFTNTYSEDIRKHGSSTEKMNELRNSIFVPSFQIEVPRKDSQTCDTCDTFSYGTRTLTVVVLDKQNNIHYYEKDIRDPSSDVDSAYIPTSKFEFPLRTY